MRVAIRAFGAHNSALVYGPSYLLASRNFIDAGGSYILMLHNYVQSERHKVGPEMNITIVFCFAAIYLICSVFPLAEYSAALVAAVITDV